MCWVFIVWENLYKIAVVARLAKDSWRLCKGHFTHEQRVRDHVTVRAQKKVSKGCPNTYSKYVAWSRTLKCSVKPYVTRPSTKYYFNEFCIRGHLRWIDDKSFWIQLLMLDGWGIRSYVVIPSLPNPGQCSGRFLDNITGQNLSIFKSHWLHVVIFWISFTRSQYILKVRFKMISNLPYVLNLNQLVIQDDPKLPKDNWSSWSYPNSGLGLTLTKPRLEISIKYKVQVPCPHLKIGKNFGREVRWPSPPVRSVCHTCQESVGSDMLNWSREST